MGHYIQCIIGKEKVIKELSDNWVYAHKVRLNSGFSLIPLTEELIDDMNELANVGSDPAFEEFQKLSKSIELVLKQNSYKEKIAYIETEYFGGTGVQAAVSYSKGNVFDGPKLTRTSWDYKKCEYIDEPIEERAINSILSGLGLEKRNDIDSFDNLGLGNFRSNEKILRTNDS